MITMDELNDIDKQIEQAKHEHEIEHLSLAMKKRQAVLFYLKTNKGIPVGDPRHVGYQRVADQFGISYEQFRKALRDFGVK